MYTTRWEVSHYLHIHPLLVPDTACKDTRATTSGNHKQLQQWFFIYKSAASCPRYVRLATKQSSSRRQRYCLGHTSVFVLYVQLVYFPLTTALPHVSHREGH